MYPDYNVVKASLRHCVDIVQVRPIHIPPFQRNNLTLTYVGNDETRKQDDFRRTVKSGLMVWLFALSTFTMFCIVL